jgi:hypothetical protein
MGDEATLFFIGGHLKCRLFCVCVSGCATNPIGQKKKVEHLKIQRPTAFAIQRHYREYF